MAINLNDLAGALTGAQEQPAAPRASRDQYGTIALDAQGTPTVMLDGGEDYAPCTCMVGVHHGDRVLAHVVNHKIVVFANITAPTTDDATALVAIDRADAAAEAADAAGIAAASAQGSADDAAAAARAADQKAAAAGSAAAAAQTSADNAATAAANAQTSADNAATAANKATYALSDVEKVVGTVNWIAEHGSYELTQDTAIVPGKVYYTRGGTSPDYVYTVVANPEASGLATYYELHLDESVQNFLASHLWLDNYGMNLSVDSANGYRIHQGTVDGTKAVGTYIIGPDGNDVARFGADGAQIGKSGAAHSVIDADGQRFYGGTNGTTQLANIGYGEGAAASGTAYAPYYTFGTRDANAAIGNYSVAEGREVEASGYNSHAEGHWTHATEVYCHAEGSQTTASRPEAHAEGSLTTASGDASHAEGWKTTASTTAAHAEGGTTTASGVYSHAEGYKSTASGLESHAEGSLTTASGNFSHAEGNGSTASGNASHAQNRHTYANGDYQTAIGQFNKIDYNNEYALIIGNGDYAAGTRSNALAVRWDGLTDVAGRTAYPLFVYATAPDEADLPVTPCFVLATSDYGLWYYDGN